jgi:hypothetical protein
MRYLNKIVFINSAHIRYAEVNLDGNVHFIGTQGVGKSTLLRAILFFYNADKSKLGIQREQKGFDDFYLPSPDSYIIYEVAHENGKFFVMAFKNQGRTAFRFVDCSYQRQFFMDDDGNVYYEWTKIHQQIGNRKYSNIIRHYSTYLDVIYGNRQNLPQELRQYFIMESAKYQNVPRTIQNIFLNQSLESRVIKDIIIDSMDFSDGGINLNVYRDHVKDFRQQYEDIWKWFKKENNGLVKVQVDAENVISKYTLYESTRRMVDELCGELCFALDRDKALLPELQQQDGVKQTELNRQNRLLQEEEGKYNVERDKLVGEEATLKVKLDDIRKKRQHYEEIGIEHICQQVAEKDVLLTRQHTLQQQIDTLTDRNRSVKDKYETLKQQELQKLSSFKNQTLEKKNELNGEKIQRISEQQAQYNKTCEEKQSYYQMRRAELDEKENIRKDDKQQLQMSQLKLQQMNPFQQQMDEYQRKINSARKDEGELRLKIQQLQQQIAGITAQTKLERSNMEADNRLYVSGMEQKIASLVADASQLQQLLDQQKGSLIEWLSGNVKGWENTFGRVLDEKAVLYNSELSPNLLKSDDAIFGVQLNLDNIDKEVRTPENIQRDKVAIEEHIEQLRADIVSHKKQLEENIQRLESKPSRQIKELRQQCAEAETNLRVVPMKISSNQKLLDEVSDQLLAWRKKELEDKQEQLAKVEQMLQLISRDKAELKSLESRELEKLKKSSITQRKEVEEEIRRRISVLDADWDKQQENSNNQIRVLNEQMDAELKGLGVDVNQLASFRQSLEKVNQQLRFINDHYREFVAWQNDKEDLFDHEQKFRDQRKLIQQKIDDLEDKYQLRRSKYTSAISLLRDELQVLRSHIGSIQQTITDVENFMNSDTCPMKMKEMEKQETVKKLVDILNNLRDNIGSQLRLMDNFKQAVATFKKHFSQQNTFHFKTEFNVDRDFIEFAVQLDEFLSNRKIEEYRLRTNNVYIEIIRRISREVNDLMSHKGMIEGTISDINKDFKENNFAGVIKDIELRSVESNDRLMQLLLTIARFVEDANMDLGEVNLFSDQDTLLKSNQRAVELLMSLIDNMDLEQKRDYITLADTFKLEFKVRENDNDTGWVEKLSNVGSDGTDILVKAMVNIMLINVFKRKVSRKFGNFRLHCLMDEIGKLHPNNVKGILDFANKRNIYLINSSPTTYTAEAYRYTYSLNKDAKSNTIVKSLLTIR